MKRATRHLLLFHIFFASVLLAEAANFSKLRQNDISDDFTLISKKDGRENTCIKAVLCENSKYFKSAIMGKFREATQNSMTLDHSFEAIKIILDFVYDQTKEFFDEPALPLNIYGELLKFSDYGFADNLITALSKVLVSFSLNQDNLDFALEIIEKHQDKNLLTQVLAKIYDVLAKDDFAIDTGWLTYLMGLDFAYNPKKQKLDIDNIALDFYLALRDQGNKSDLNNLNRAIDIVSIHLQPEEITPALRAGVLREDFTLLWLALQFVKDERNPNQELIEIILGEIEKDNLLMVRGLKRIRLSELWNLLWANHESLIMDKLPAVPAAQNIHILNMAEWSQDEREHALANYESIEYGLIQNLENHLLNYAFAMDLQTCAQFTCFFVAYRNLYLPAELNVIGNNARGSAMHAAWTAMVNAAWNGAWSNAYNPCHFAAKHEALDAIRLALRKIKLNDPQEIGSESSKLTKLFILAYVAQPEYHEAYFHRAYNASIRVLKHDVNFTLSIDEVISFIGKRTWELENLADNPYILSLKIILETIKPDDNVMIIED